jgi:hypothetical protein
VNTSNLCQLQPETKYYTNATSVNYSICFLAGAVPDTKDQNQKEALEFRFKSWFADMRHTLVKPARRLNEALKLAYQKRCILHSARRMVQPGNDEEMAQRP